MVAEINNQRAAFLGSRLAWFEWTDNGCQKTRNHGYDVIVGGEFTDYSDHPRKLVTLNLKLQPTGAGRYQLLSRWWDAYRSLAWKTSSPKSLWTLTVALRSVALHHDWSWWYPSGQSTVAAISGLTAGRWLSGLYIRLNSLDWNVKVGGTVREIDVWAESSWLSPLWLSASSSACHGPLIITAITPLPTKPSATKMPENWSWRTRQLLTCRCVSVMLLRSMQNTRRS